MDRTQFEPGWLMKTCEAATIRCMSDHSPSFFERGPAKFKRPISDADARKVFDVMNARFMAWTGISLAEFSARTF